MDEQLNCWLILISRSAKVSEHTSNPLYDAFYYNSINSEFSYEPSQSHVHHQNIWPSILLDQSSGDASKSLNSTQAGPQGSKIESPEQSLSRRDEFSNFCSTWIIRKLLKGLQLDGNSLRINFQKSRELEGNGCALIQLFRVKDYF